MKKTETMKINGNTYQRRLIPCGLDRRDGCTTCQQDGGHVAYYRDDGLVNGKRKWTYIGATAPEVDPNYTPEPATCQAPGCDNPVLNKHGKPARKNARFCSAKCRVAVHRAQQ
jgi:hypothetical protein